MKIDIVTIFPEIARAPLTESMMKRAQDAGFLDLQVHNLRNWAVDKHRKTDDLPFGGGPGMVMKPEPFFACVEDLKSDQSTVILMTPSGHRFTQSQAQKMSSEQHLIVLCGHYEGVDQRVIDCLVDVELSIGDFVLTNGAIAAAVMIDAIVRIIPGVLGDAESAITESFSEPCLDWPQYTRPAEFRGNEVPQVLRGGNHAAIKQWRAQKALELTQERRPDLLE